MKNGAGFGTPTDKGDKLLSSKMIVKNDQNLGPDKARENAETARGLVAFIKTCVCNERKFKYL